MPQTHDITLGTAGYMVAPNSYRRGTEGASPATRRVVQRGWAGGGLQPYGAGDERFWSSLALLPVAGGGVGPGPAETSLTLGGLHPTARRHATLHGGRPYFAAGGALYRPERAGLGLNPNNLASATQLGATLAGDCTGLASDGGAKLYLSRAGQPFAAWTIGGSAFDTSATLPLAGCAWYAGSLWGGLFDGTLWRLVRVTGGGTYEGAGWPIDSAPRAFAALRDGLYFGTGGALTTGLWHADAPDAAKAWTRVGAELAWPDGGTFGTCTAALAYSADGATFAAAGSASVASAAPRTIAFDLPAGVVGKWLALRYTLADVTTGAPTLAALWAEYRPAEPGPRRRTWAFDLLAADQTTRRDGAPDPRPGATIAADLWAAWEAGTTLAFRDLDYDLAPITRTVRIIALEETIPAPADAGRWHDARLRVRIIEV